MKIEVGKTYLTRDRKHRLTVDAMVGKGRFPMRCKDDAGKITWRTRDGTFYMASIQHPHDLVKEIPGETAT